MKSRLLCALIVAVLCPSLSATTTVAGNIKTLGATSAGNSFVRFWLRGCNGNQPRVNAVAIVPSNTNGQFYFDFAASSVGAVSGTLYSTRDATGLLGGEIDCGGSHTAAWYGMQVFRNSVGGPETPVHAKNTGILDVTSVTPVTTNPVTTSPTGDTTYLRTDAGNSPVTGPVQFNAVVTPSAGVCNPRGPLDVVACYGADPTAVTDSTAALNAAFSAASNATRYIPAGVYKISGTLNIDTRYRVEGVPGTETTPYSTVIQAATGFTGTMAKVISTYAQTSVVLGGMQGLFFDCSAQASIGLIYGGHATLTTFGYRTSDTVFHNCTTAGAQVAANAWLLSWHNVGFQGNGGDGLQVLDQANEGENLACYSCTFSNNTGNGLTMGPATIIQHDFHCHSCSFDTNGGWQIQNQTVSTGDSVVDLHGSYIFSHAKWISNFGRMTITGSFFGDGANSGLGSGYLVDNEAQLQIFGGRWTNSGGGTILNAAQSGTTNCYSLPGLPTTKCTSYVDGSSGNAIFGGLTAGGNISLGTIFQIGSNLLFSATAPTINTHFNTSGDSISFANGTAAFRITVGSGTGTSTGIINLPSAPNHWNCFVQNKSRAALVLETADSNTSATFTNFGTTFAATNWTNGDVLQVSCFAM
jgi:hypothetical protein